MKMQWKGNTAAAWSKIRSSAVFSRWSDSDLERLCEEAHLLSVPAGATVIEQQVPVKGLYAIITGSVDVCSLQPDGRRYVRRHARPGTLFGLVSLVDGEGSPYSYVAQEECGLLFVPGASFFAVLDRSPELWEGVALHIAGFQRIALTVLDERVFENLAIRLARLLLSMAQPDDRRDPNSGQAVCATQEDLGALLGVSRQSVNKELNRLSSAGLIRVEYGRIVLDDLQGLTARSTDEGKGVSDRSRGR